MKKIVALIVLLVVFFTALNTTEALVAQMLIQVPDHIRQMDQRRQAERQQGTAIAVVSIILIALGIYFYTQERDKKQREWQEKQDEKNREYLAQKLQENKSSDPPDK